MQKQTFIIKNYSTNKFALPVRFDVEEKTIWLSQEELATLLESNVKTISRILLSIEKGENNNPRLSKMRITDSNLRVNIYNLEYVELSIQKIKGEKDNDFINWVTKIFESIELQNYEIICFSQDNLSLEVRISPDHETVWLNQDEIAKLFDTTQQNVSTHIINILDQGELEKVSVHKFFLLTGKDGKQHEIDFYNLDMILAIGYRVNSKQGIAFRKWANGVLKDYLIKGYAINEKRLNSLGKTVDIQNRMLASTLSIDFQELSNVISEYTRALDLLDDYDHQSLKKPKGHETTYQLSYKDAREMIDKMKFNLTSDLFGREKEEGKLEGILAAVHQHVFGQEVYPSLEEKAAHLLYFLVKDHPFYDGCKRIAATLFLEFLNRNGVLIKNNKLLISNDALVAITLLTAESNPDEMEIIVSVIMNLLV